MEIINQPSNPHIISYKLLRKLIGFIGILLPVVLVLGSFITGKYTTVQPSISDYYFTTMGDVFVGNLCAVSLFLFCYKGYDYRDNITANLAAFFAVCIALFPTTTNLERNHLGIIENESVASALHFTSAVLFFCCLAFFCIYLFRLPRDKENQSREKKIRNNVYLTCGSIILLCIVFLGLYFGIKSLQEKLSGYYPVIILETLALWAFGISWIVKGEALLKDVKK